MKLKLNLLVLNMHHNANLLMKQIKYLHVSLPALAAIESHAGSYQPMLLSA